MRTQTRVAAPIAPRAAPTGEDGGMRGIEAAVGRVGDRWTLLVVDALLSGPRRFGELEHDLPGVASNVLAKRLRHLEDEGLVVAEPYSDRPVRMAYRLTATGQELAGALRLLAQWGAAAGGSADGEASTPGHGTCGTPLEARWWCPTCEQQVDDPHAEGGLRFA